MMNKNVGFIYLILLDVISNSSSTNKQDNCDNTFHQQFMVKLNINSALSVNRTVGVAKGQEMAFSIAKQ